MNNDLISREALKEHKVIIPIGNVIGGVRCGKTRELIIKEYQKGWNDAIDTIIDNAPTVPNEYMRGYEAAEREYKRPQGKWLFDKENSFTIDIFKCSICGYFGHTHFKFCPNCGADMRKEDKK